jgi:DNA modification methylase
MVIELKFEKFDGTFQKSKMLPFHRWYPFTEGFGERLVCEIIREFADKTTYLVDPFAGCGTALLVASKLGLRSGYCEINPFLRFVIETKINAPVRLAQKYIDAISQLSNFMKSLESSLINSLPVSKISLPFGNRPYFDDDILETLLKLKYLVCEVFGQDEELRNIALLALAGILVDVSNLKRAGDLRYRREREKSAQHITSSRVIDLFKQRLQWVIEDLKQPERPVVPTDFLGEDALNVRPMRYADLVVTSPSYLNGTNYVRNTKLELWFLEFVKSEDDLARLHHKLLTSGINHVSRHKDTVDLPVAVMEVIEKLKKVAYDRRIPLMVHQYFSEMKKFFENLSNYTVPSGAVFIDIGDSTFCGVHIPTHEFVKILAQNAGFDYEGDYLIRTRRSRGGGTAAQYLLRFKKKASLYSPTHSDLSPIITHDEENFDKLIRNFQETLPYREYPYCKRNWGHKYHSLCSYQSKLKPAIAHFLVKLFVESSGLIVDPFGGVGTISLEAKLLGHPSITVDISPTAFVVAKAKLERVNEKEVLNSYNSLVAFVRKHKNSVEIKADMEQYSDFGFNKKLIDYYHPETFKEILAARRWLRMRTNGNLAQICAADAFVTGCLLHLLHGNRPYSLSRRSHPITPFAPAGRFEYRSLEDRLLKKIKKTYDEAISTREVYSSVVYGDACQLSSIVDKKVDAIITSPPFIHSTRFHTNNWIRNWFCGWEPHDFIEEKHNFVEVLQEKSLDIYRKLLEEWEKVLNPNGLVIFHLGTTKECDMVEEVANRVPAEYKILGKVYEFVRDRETHGISAQGRIVRHGFLFLKKVKV